MASAERDSDAQSGWTRPASTLSYYQISLMAVDQATSIPSSCNVGIGAVMMRTRGVSSGQVITVGVRIYNTDEHATYRK